MAGEPGGGTGAPSRHGSWTLGLVLILIGVFFLVVEYVPGLKSALTLRFSWPLIVIGVGVFLAVVGVATLTPDMAIPACIVAGIGGILYYQNLSGDWESWAYLWTLIPGFVGVGMLIASAFRPGASGRRRAVAALSQILSSVFLFTVFGSFLGGPSWLGRYWPVALILLGLWVLLWPRRHWRRWDRWVDGRERRKTRVGGSGPGDVGRGPEPSGPS